jgi:small subunit ribosomal protein S17
MSEQTQNERGFRRTMSGKVVSDKMDKTVVVEVVSRTRDALYGKYVRTRKRFKAHDETNQYKTGDDVEITEAAPMSRHKRFVVTKLVKKFIQE